MSKLVKITKEQIQNKEIFKGDIFVVPNPANKPTEVSDSWKDCDLFDPTDEKKFADDVEFYGKDVVDFCIENKLPSIKAWGVAYTFNVFGKEHVNDSLIEVWTTGGILGENWGDHGMNNDKLKKFNFGFHVHSGYFANHMPASFFQGLKEGDHLYLQIEGEDIVFDLTLNQNKYRYRYCGDFEMAVQMVL